MRKQLQSDVKSSHVLRTGIMNTHVLDLNLRTAAERRTVPRGFLEDSPGNPGWADPDTSHRLLWDTVRTPLKQA